jgi:uncharacterized protein YegJ (DUF2314 family)
MNTATLKLLFIVPLLAAGGCATQRAEHPVAREAVRQGRNPEIFYIKDEDMAMGIAVHKARKTLGTFIAAVQHPSPTQHDFEVKKLFIQGAEGEHIWLSDVTYSGNSFHGRLDNHPHKITGLKIGDRVSATPKEISDWAYVDHGNLVGGYTIRVLYKELSPQRRKDLENESRFRITDQ